MYKRISKEIQEDGQKKEEKSTSNTKKLSLRKIDDVAIEVFRPGELLLLHRSRSQIVRMIFFVE